MNNIITASMFDSIKQALVKNENNSVGKFMKTEVGNTYTVRLLPNIKDPSKTFFHYFTFGWTSYSTGQYINLVSPQTWGDRDPINEYRYKITKTGSQEEKDKASKILRKENWLVNVYVINDPKNPENNGQVKLLKFGRQLHKIIMDAIEGAIHLVRESLTLAVRVVISRLRWISKVNILRIHLLNSQCPKQSRILPKIRFRRFTMTLLILKGCSLLRVTTSSPRFLMSIIIAQPHLLQRRM